jgi:hypothetical protein
MAIEITLKTYDIWNHTSQLNFLSAVQNQVRKLPKDTSKETYGLEFVFYSTIEFLPMKRITRSIELICEQMRLFLGVKDTNTLVIDNYTIKIINRAAENKIIVRRYD